MGAEKENLDQEIFVDDQTMVDAAPVPSVPPVLPIVPPVIMPPMPVIPPIAPIPMIAPAVIPRPLAPIPPRPPVLRPPVPVPVPSKGEVRSGNSDSDEDDVGVEESGAGYEFAETSKMMIEQKQKAIQEMFMKRRAAALAVPTNDKAVRSRLRRLGEPITLFGEREMERRERFRMLMAKLDSEGQLEKLMKANEDEEKAATVVAHDAEEEAVKYPFFTEGSKELLAVRIDIAKYSISRAALRIQRAQRKREDPDEDEDAEIEWALKQAASLTLDSSEIGDDRPLSGCSFSNDGQLLATWYLDSFCA